ncbi:dicarboxylate/amino acid:cation symporter [Sandaracinus amylolyticus]|uniref:Proton/glutamate symport protein n=1 Tax=Sandaracinus amylolyticus TaxID=927083 RepID=A0A0F6YFL0_9BACT|nr:cation:dicarboxylase symporter family transporter [Sandaracinus amylolyticus]AKF03688.1 Proton/glutamate symport protein [Sandaracinus amylolyticus]
MSISAPAEPIHPVAKKPWYRSGTLWIVVGLVLGVVLGGFFPQDQHPVAYELFRFLSRAFIALIKGLIVPLLVSTIIVGIAQTGDLKAVGRMGAKALIYFEVVTTIALFVGLFVANWLRPGDGLPIDLSATSGVAPAAPQSGWDLALHLFPSNLAKHWAEADLLPIVVFAVLFGISLTRIGERGAPVMAFAESVAQVMFKYTDLVMRLTPLGVFGAMAYNVSHMAAGHEVDGHVVHGWPAVFYLLGRYARLVGSLYLALLIFFTFVLVPVMLIVRIKVLPFLRQIREPALTAFTTASSEAALPRLLEDVIAFGVPRRVASFVIPAGYSFNLDGSTLYLVLASLTIAQAAHIELTISQQLLMVLAFMLTSKGVAGVPRATLVIIAGTAASFGLPGEAGVAMLLAVDEVMDMARTTINVIGNGLASVVIARWEGVLGTNPEESAKLDV